jgi:hypothetical protein
VTILIDTDAGWRRTIDGVVMAQAARDAPGQKPSGDLGVEKTGDPQMPSERGRDCGFLSKE